MTRRERVRMCVCARTVKECVCWRNGNTWRERNMKKDMHTWSNAMGNKLISKNRSIYLCSIFGSVILLYISVVISKEERCTSRIMSHRFVMPMYSGPEWKKKSYFFCWQTLRRLAWKKSFWPDFFPNLICAVINKSKEISIDKNGDFAMSFSLVQEIFSKS